MNSEILKLVGILVGGIVVGVVGFLFQKKMQKKKAEEMAMMQENYGGDQNINSGSSNEELSEAQKAIRDYILNYKSSYSRDQIKAALVQAGNLESDVDAMLDKYM